MKQNPLTKHVRHIKTTDRYRKRMADRMSVKQAIRAGVPFARRIMLQFRTNGDAAVEFLDIALFRIEDHDSMFVLECSTQRIPSAWLAGRLVAALFFDCSSRFRFEHPKNPVIDQTTVEQFFELTDEGFEEIYEHSMRLYFDDEIENIPF